MKLIHDAVWFCYDFHFNIESVDLCNSVLVSLKNKSKKIGFRIDRYKYRCVVSTYDFYSFFGIFHSMYSVCASNKLIQKKNCEQKTTTNKPKNNNKKRNILKCIGRKWLYVCSSQHFSDIRKNRAFFPILKFIETFYTCICML